MKIAINSILYFLTGPVSTVTVVVLSVTGGVWLCNLIETHTYNRLIRKHPENKEIFEKEIKKQKKQQASIWVILLAILAAPTVINLVISGNHVYPTASDLGNPEWLGFWGSYMGGVIGAIVTGVVFFFTYKQNEKQHKQTRELLHDQDRKAVMPFIDINIISKADFEKRPQIPALDLWPSKPTSYFIEREEFEDSGEYLFTHSHVIVFSNVGAAAALEVVLKHDNYNMKIGTIVCDSPTQIIFVMYAQEIDHTYIFDLDFKDIRGNNYTQNWIIKYCQSENDYYLQAPSFPRHNPNIES